MEVRRSAGVGGGAAGKQGEQGPIAAVCRPTVGTVTQMGPDRRGLYRAKLLIQIFPETTLDLRTLHRRDSSLDEVTHGHPVRW
jgi:hypothetical protein